MTCMMSGQQRCAGHNESLFGSSVYLLIKYTLAFDFTPNNHVFIAITKRVIQKNIYKIPTLLGVLIARCKQQ